MIPLAAADIVEIILGSGGAVATLAGTVSAWLHNRTGRRVRVHVQVGDDNITLESTGQDAEAVTKALMAALAESPELGEEKETGTGGAGKHHKRHSEPTEG